MSGQPVEQPVSRPRRWAAFAVRVVRGRRLPAGPRERAHLASRYSSILANTGLIIALGGAVTLTPLLVLPFVDGEGSLAWGFVPPALLMMALGIGARRWFRQRAGVLSEADAGVVIVLSWLLVCLFSAWPFMAAGGLSFTQAIFESTSGWTTTGLSVVDVTKAPAIVLLWRSIMQLVGGAGFAVIMLAALIGPSGPAIPFAEGRTDQLVPNVRQSARLVLRIYTGHTLIAIAALWLTGMSFFDAVNHAFAVVSTGGFSTRVESIGHWNSPLIEAVTVALMLIANLNFATAWLLLRRNGRAARRNGEVRLMALVIPIAVAALLLLTCREIYPAMSKAVRVAVFETVTALTTTGFSTVGYGDWNAFGVLVLLILMLIGGGTCSTAGAIKQYRIYLLVKSLAGELRRMVLPARAVTQVRVWEGDQAVFVDDARFRRIGTFVALYVATWLVGAAVLCAHGFSIRDALFEYASSIGTVGLSVGVTSPGAPGTVLWVQTLGMLLGRLEFFVVIAAIMKVIRDTVALAPSPQEREG